VLNDTNNADPSLVAPMMARLGREDLYFLMTQLLGRVDMYKRPEIQPDWLYHRVCDIQEEPDGCLDLWAREHYKSTVITYGKTIQDILCNPDDTFGIFSCTRPIAKAFLGQIKAELEQNELLKDLYPDILWQNPNREAPRWSLDGGIVVKRKSNPKESTIEAWGLVDGQPTSKHFSVLVYDDVVTLESVSTPEMIEKVTERYSVSLNLGAHGGRRRIIGTRYHFNDTYKTIMDRGSVKERIFPATDNGDVDGKAVFLIDEALREKRRDMGPYVFGCQMLQNPKADGAMGFKEEWLRYYDPEITTRWSEHFRYIVVDPAGEKKKGNDYTVMWVIALGEDKKYYVIDGIRDRLNLKEKWEHLLRLHKKWKPQNVGYEKYGLQADIEYMKEKQEELNYRFDIVELGGIVSKNDRIRRLVPLFNEGRFYIPTRLIRQDYEGTQYDLTAIFKNNEYLPFPVCSHDDMLDCMARILEPVLAAIFPEDAFFEEESSAVPEEEYNPLGHL